MIVDHDHVTTYRGMWATGFCGKCGKHVACHLSWGRLMASRIGGDPLDYVHKDEPVK